MIVLFWALVVASVIAAVALGICLQAGRRADELAEELRQIEPRSPEQMEYDRRLWRQLKCAVRKNRKVHKLECN